MWPLLPIRLHKSVLYTLIYKQFLILYLFRVSFFRFVFHLDSWLFILHSSILFLVFYWSLFFGRRPEYYLYCIYVFWNYFLLFLVIMKIIKKYTRNLCIYVNWEGIFLMFYLNLRRSTLMDRVESGGWFYLMLWNSNIW